MEECGKADQVGSGQCVKMKTMQARFMRIQVKEVFQGEKEQLYQKWLISQKRTEFSLALWRPLPTYGRVILVEELMAEPNWYGFKSDPKDEW